MNIFNNKNTDLDTENKLMITCREKEEDRARQDRELRGTNHIKHISYKDIVQQKMKKICLLKLSDNKFRGQTLILSIVKMIQVNVNFCSIVLFH